MLRAGGFFSLRFTNISVNNVKISLLSVCPAPNLTTLKPFITTGREWFSVKAILLAGGEGTRLRPLTADLPKPMVPLFGRPVLEHLILLLRRHGITQIAMTLGYLPDKITDYFRDGSPWGVSITYFTEETPLGTAGGVKACRPFLLGED